MLVHILWHLIWVYTVCSGMSVWILRVKTLYVLVYLAWDSFQVDKEEKSEKDTASKDGKVDKQEAKPAGKDASGKEKGGKDSKDKGTLLIFL